MIPDAPPAATAPTPPAASFARRLLGDRLLRAAVLATLVVSLVLVAFPAIDVAVARIFHHPGVAPLTEFPAEKIVALDRLRNAGMAVTRWATILLVLALLAKLLAPLLARAVPTRNLLFLLASLALGPGLMVNAFFKEVWGRPRPSETTLFGGPWEFARAWVPGGACPTNCSFPSGEASGAAWLLALVFVVPERWRRTTLALVVTWMTVISLNRMAFGSHFLSDVTIGWGLMAIVVLLCRRLILEDLSEGPIDRIDRTLARLGDRLLGLLGRRDRGGAPEHF